ncbi:MAG: PrgI family protein [Candidatus Saccharimonadales bacterium]
MAQYKVPQDVEADDKLLGPFTFRQFVYLLIVAGFIGLAVALFQVFPLLVIIPVPVILFFGALALPIKKDQPMETYLSAIVSFYLKPRKRMWDAGQPESTILITAPKKIERSRTKDISQEEATHRLSFLAEIVDSEGYAIKGATTSPIREEIKAEAETVPDMFDVPSGDRIERALENETAERHADLVSQMRQAIEKAENHNLAGDTAPSIQKFDEKAEKPVVTPASVAAVINESEANTKAPDIAPLPEPNPADSVIVQPMPMPIPMPAAPTPAPAEPVAPAESTSVEEPSADIINLANNKELSVETIAKEAQRLSKKKQDGEVYVSLH